MAFIDIYNLVQSHINVPNRAYLTVLINKAAEDLYSQSDLVNCLREQAFRRDNDTSAASPVLQYTLPYYVWKLRGMREYTTGLNITNHDMRPRYQTQGWREFVDPYLYRVKNNLPLARDILNEGALTIELPDGETVVTAFSVFVTGSNSSKTRFTEQVDFVAGDTSKVTTNIFSTVEAIRKSVQTDFDLHIFDTDSNEVSFIANCEFVANYTLIQCTDDSLFSPYFIEVLYKTKFFPFKNDSDEYPCGNIYDTAIYWKTLEYYYARHEEPEKVVQFYTKANEAVNNIGVDFNDNQEKLIDFGANQYLNMLPSRFSRTPLNPYWRMFKPN